MEVLKSQNQPICIAKGILISFIITIVLLTIFAGLLVYTNLPESVTKPVTLTITCFSLIIGSSICTKKLKTHGLLNGGIVGIGYILVLYIISSIVNSNFTINLMSISMIIIRNNWWNCWRNSGSKYKISI